MTVTSGLRERKKQQTRQQIHETAWEMFRQRGFEAVTVAEVARAAQFSEVTVFNYFPTKEDLFFGGMEFFEEVLLAGVRERAVGVSALDEVRRLVLDGCRNLRDGARVAAIARSASVIAASPALQARERQIVDRYTHQLGTLLAGQAGVDPHDVEPHAVAGALMGAHRALVGYTRARVLAGERGAALAGAVRAQAVRAFARLAGGLAGYPAGQRSVHIG